MQTIGNILQSISDWTVIHNNSDGTSFIIVNYNCISDQAFIYTHVIEKTVVILMVTAVLGSEPTTPSLLAVKYLQVKQLS